MRKFSFPYRNKQIFMIPNRYGFVAILLFIVFSLVAATYSNNLLFLLAFAHVSFILICILQTARNLRHVEIGTVQIPSGFPGERVPVSIVLLQKAKSLKTGLLIRCEKSELLIPEFAANDQKILALDMELPATRGEHHLRRLRLSTDSPYGLFYGWLYFKVSVSYYVYPLPAGQPLPQSQQSAGIDEFSGLKPCQAGDSPQRISWKHSSKADQLLIKEFKEASTPSYLLNWEDCTQLLEEEKLQQLAKWIVDCESSQNSYKLQMPNTMVQSSFDRGFSHFHQSLLTLAKWNSTTPDSAR